jgi:hypothetical protein
VLKKLSEDLYCIVERAETVLRETGEEAASVPVLKGGWSRKQVVGHLIDSASNNHQRFVRAAIQGSLEFPEYDQVACVRVQAFQEAKWETLVDAWCALNRLLVHILAHLPAESAAAPCRIGGHASMTVQQVARGYVDHLRHHLGQIGIATT